ncbi:DUF4383 domain-containing protein [Candidatus Peregrinibacteria bacterium]|nr:DUF4383 domain-containing protein [Candidatus Peregrinibacteria bacterium]
MSALVRPVTQLLGVVFVLLGIAGFFMGDMVFIFEVNTIHNVVHLATGLVALWAASAGKERMFLTVFGVIYAAVAFVGFTSGGDVLGLFHANDADNYLHAVVALVCIVLGTSRKG